MKSVSVCIPSQDHCAAWFAYDLARLVGYSVAQGLGVNVCLCKTAYLPSMRRELAKLAIGSGADSLLFLDSDMRFPKDALVRLLRHKEPIVAASYSMRRLPLAPVAFDGYTQGQLHYVANDAEGLEEVASVGMGCFLIDLDVFKKLDEPWFANEYDAALDDYIGEDVHFCRKAREAGYRILVDAKLTNEMGHLGEWNFTNAQLNEWTERANAVGAESAAV